MSSLVTVQVFASPAARVTEPSVRITAPGGSFIGWIRCLAGRVGARSQGIGGAASSRGAADEEREVSYRLRPTVVVHHGLQRVSVARSGPGRALTAPADMERSCWPRSPKVQLIVRMRRANRRCPQPRGKRQYRRSPNRAHWQCGRPRQGLPWNCRREGHTHPGPPACEAVKLPSET